MSAIDRLVHAHLQDLYRHIACLYPLVDADAVIDDVFITAARQGHTPGPATRWQLYHLVRDAVRLRFPDSGWQSRNAAAVTQSLRHAANLIGDWHTWTDLDTLLGVLDGCPVAEQEILALVTFTDDLTASQLAIILAVDDATAERLLEQTTATFRAACSPPAGGGGTP